VVVRIKAVKKAGFNGLVEGGKIAFALDRKIGSIWRGRYDRELARCAEFSRTMRCGAVNPSSDYNRGAKRFGRGVRREPRCWHPQHPRTTHIGTNCVQPDHLSRD
jgi:hypothetical protein